MSSQLSLRVDDDLLDDLDSEAMMLGVSRSEYVRDILENRQEARRLERELDECRNRLETREERIETLESELARRSSIEDRVDELAIEVRDDRQAADAPFFVKWYRWFRSR